MLLLVCIVFFFTFFFFFSFFFFFFFNDTATTEIYTLSLHDALPIYELGGPEILSFREIIELILEITDRKRALVSLPFGLARLQALFLQFAPGAMKLTPDQVDLLRSDNVVSDTAKAAGLTLEGLGITPDSIETIAP